MLDLIPVPQEVPPLLTTLGEGASFHLALWLPLAVGIWAGMMEAEALEARSWLRKPSPSSAVPSTELAWLALGSKEEEELPGQPTDLQEKAELVWLDQEMQAAHRNELSRKQQSHPSSPAHA